jgi:hypothetical protein
MAVTVPSILVTNFKEVVGTWQDFRGQSRGMRILVDATASDANLGVFLTGLDNTSNARFRRLDILTSQEPTGQKASASNIGAEVNIDEIMELTFQATDTSNPLKTIVRSILIPAMVSSIEQIDGSPIPVPTVRPGVAGASQDLYDVVAFLETHLTAKNAAGTYQQGFTYRLAKSHHIGLEDVIDTH